MKSAGYGEVVDFKIKKNSSRPVVFATGAEAPPRRLRVAARFDRPLLVDARRISANVYESAAVIPGGAIKGALAETIRHAGEAPEKNAALTALRISHAHPEGYDRALPHSVVLSDDGVVGDALRVPVGRGAMIGDDVARFGVDWKGDEATSAAGALSIQNPPAMRKDPRMHVAIARDTGGAADQQLHVTTLTDPAETRFIFDCDFGGAAKQDATALMALIREGLDGIGGTNARMDTEVIEAPAPPRVRPVHWAADHYAVTLETDAVMAQHSDGESFEAYAEYWRRVCDGAELVNLYASQRLAGGYVGMRFRVRDGAYKPFLLTETGSVFLLKGDISERLQTLVRDGLPSPLIEDMQTNWETCPFQPENGYGRIRADHDAALSVKVRHV